MIKNHHWHTNMMITTSIGVSLVAIYSLINSSFGNISVASYQFPQKIPLFSWKYIDSHTININQLNAVNKSKNILSANRYQYQEKNTQLNIEMYYVIDTRGNLDHLLLEKMEITPESLEKQNIKQQDNNYYSLFQEGDRTYLSSCLNPTGNSTVTAKQFSQSLNQRPINLNLLKNWLLGKSSIRDRRCLWVMMSINNNSSFLKSSDILEEVWQNWHKWWQPRFPNLR